MPLFDKFFFKPAQPQEPVKTPSFPDTDLIHVKPQDVGTPISSNLQKDAQGNVITTTFQSQDVGRIAPVDKAHELAIIANKGISSALARENEMAQGITKQESDNVEIMEHLQKTYPNAFQEKILKDGTKLLICKNNETEISNLPVEERLNVFGLDEKAMRDYIYGTNIDFSANDIIFSKDGITLIEKNIMKELDLNDLVMEIRKAPVREDKKFIKMTGPYGGASYDVKNRPQGIAYYVGQSKENATLLANIFSANNKLGTYLKEKETNVSQATSVDALKDMFKF